MFTYRVFFETGDSRSGSSASFASSLPPAERLAGLQTGYLDLAIDGVDTFLPAHRIWRVEVEETPSATPEPDETDLVQRAASPAVEPPAPALPSTEPAADAAPEPAPRSRRGRGEP